MGLLLEILYILRELSLTKALLCLPTNYQAYLALHKSILAMPPNPKDHKIVATNNHS